jgi:hypothetical protein
MVPHCLVARRGYCAALSDRAGLLHAIGEVVQERVLRQGPEPVGASPAPRWPACREPPGQRFIVLTGTGCPDCVDHGSGTHIWLWQWDDALCAAGEFGEGFLGDVEVGGDEFGG